MKKILFTALAVLMISFWNCKENSVEATLDSIQSADDNASAENEFGAVFDYINTEGSNATSINGIALSKQDEIQTRERLLPECATLTIDSASRTMTIDFGITNCLCNDGRYRRGKVIAVFSGKWKDLGSSVTVSLENYYVNDNKVTGTKTITHTAAHTWHTVVTDASVTTETGTISWTADRTVEQTAGYNTLTIWDDSYKVTGSATGTNRKGTNFTVTIDEPLIKKIQLGCASVFVDGKWTLVNDGGVTMTLNYDPIGGEPCDKIAEVTINGKTRRITLR
ncbi:MAG: hypothetical protein WCT77_05090 [Bacteroidota bacterium]